VSPSRYRVYQSLAQSHWSNFHQTSSRPQVISLTAFCHLQESLLLRHSFRQYFGLRRTPYRLGARLSVVPPGHFSSLIDLTRLCVRPFECASFLQNGHMRTAHCSRWPYLLVRAYPAFSGPSGTPKLSSTAPSPPG